MHAEEIRKKDQYLKKLVSAARAVISNQVALPFGVIRIVRILAWLQPLSDVEYPIFRSFLYEAERQSLPLSTDRLLWNPDKLAEKDEQLQEIVERYRKDIIEECWNITKAYGQPQSKPEEPGRAQI